MKKIASIVIVLILAIGVYLTTVSDDVPTSAKQGFKFKPAKFRADVQFMCGANKSRETAKLYFYSDIQKLDFNGRSYIWNRNGGIEPELTYYVTSDHYSNPNQLYMEVEKDGSSIRISGDSVTPKGIIYSCFEVD